MSFFPRIFLAMIFLLSPSAHGLGADEEILAKTIEIESADGTLLAGLLVTPVEPVAGLVLLPGSGPAVRADLEPLGRELATRGIAALAFDKRGCGQSQGSWVESSLNDLASDAIAGLEALGSVPRISGLPLGLWGHSQGAWVATVAAARSERAAFLIGVSGGGLSPRETEMYQYRSKLDHAGIAPAEKVQALALVESYFAYLETGQGRDEIARELEAATRWGDALDLARILVSEKNRPSWSWVATFDPREAAGTLKAPVLLVFGGQDHLLPLKSTVSAWTESLAASGNADFSVRIFPRAGHGIRIGGGHHGEDGVWAPGYLDLLGDWIRARSRAYD